MPAQQHHQHSPANRHATYARPQLPGVRCIPGGNGFTRPLPCTRLRAGLSQKHSIQAITAERGSPADQAGPAVSQVPSDWQEPLEPMLWHVSNLTEKKTFQVTCITSVATLCCTGAIAERCVMQGSETEARKRVPADMAPPWKVSHSLHQACFMLT